MRTIKTILKMLLLCFIIAMISLFVNGCKASQKAKDYSYLPFIIDTCGDYTKHKVGYPTWVKDVPHNY